MLLRYLISDVMTRCQDKIPLKYIVKVDRLALTGEIVRGDKLLVKHSPILWLWWQNCDGQCGLRSRSPYWCWALPSFPCLLC
ncbi:MAG TPA: hypothetical protein V6C50_08215 [Crinalium sp.]